LKLSDIRVSQKLWGAILALLAAMVIVNIATNQYLSRVEARAAVALEHQDDLITTATKWRAIIQRNSAMVYALSFSADKTAGDYFASTLKDYIKESGGIQQYLVANATSDADKRALDAMAEQRTSVLATTKKMADMHASGASGLGDILTSEMIPTNNRYMAAVDAFVKIQETARDTVKAQADHARQVASWISMAATLIVCLIGMACAAGLVRSITQPLERVVGLAESIAKGDLTQRIDDRRGDEFGQLQKAMQRMSDALANVVGNVLSATESITTASSEIATGNLDLSARTEQSAASLAQTAASMKELTQGVRQNAQAAGQAYELTTAASEVATRGGRVVGEVVTTMDDITAASQKITDIIGVIDGIAFQTNILALNAAVEAARAGEQGRGFAVVAGEVRTLAQRSAQAAKEIKDLINSTTAKVETGSELVHTAGATMQEIVTSVGRVTSIMNEIKASSSEQSTGIHEVDDAIGNLDEMTQRNAALVEEAAAAASSLQEQAAQLAATVHTFRVK